MQDDAVAIVAMDMGTPRSRDAHTMQLELRGDRWGEAQHRRQCVTRGHVYGQ